MSTVGSQARVTIAGAKRDAAEAESIPDRAWHIWKVARLHAAVEGDPFELDGSAGWKVELQLIRFIHELWPRLNDNDRETVRSDIYQFLRQTGNAICVTQRREGRQPIWWIRDTWNTAAGTVVIHGATKLSRAERKLTRHEAGEDREPAPVKVRHGGPPKGTINDALVVGRTAKIQRQRDALDMAVLEALELAGGALSRTGLAQWVYFVRNGKLAKSGGADTSHAPAIERLLEQGMIVPGPDVPSMIRGKASARTYRLPDQEHRLAPAKPTAPEPPARKKAAATRRGETAARGYERMILEAFDASGPVLRGSWLKDTTGLSDGTMHRALGRLVVAGKLERVHRTAWRDLRGRAVPASPTPTPVAPVVDIDEITRQVAARLGGGPSERELELEAALADAVATLERYKAEAGDYAQVAPIAVLAKLKKAQAR